MSGAGNPVAVLGAGSWGTALAIHLARNGHPVRLWGHLPDHVALLARERENRQFLPGTALPPNLEVSDRLEAAAEFGDLLIVVPSHAFRTTLRALRPLLPAAATIAWGTKGFEHGSGRLLHEVAREEAPGVPLAVVSGPTFAREVAAGLPTALTVAGSDADAAGRWAHLLHGSSLRAYSSTDLVGVGLGGAVKNVLAIAAGIADGLGFGANTRSALITRGLAEMMRLGDALGGRRETFMGLAGLGDLVLTCTDNQSRNRRLGLALAEGATLERALETIGQAVEGVQTAAEVRRVAARAGVEMPISEITYRVLHEGLGVQEAVALLLGRERRAE